MKKNIALIFFCLLLDVCFAATVDTISIYSAAMNKSSKCVIITPDSYKKNRNRYPVLYLLHGHSGDYSNWIKKVPAIKEYADRYQLIITCPDGHNSSWYFDSPVDSSMKYESYIGIEVPRYVDDHYRTVKKRTARAITGLSMGGHGALFLGLRHPEIFGACGSMSGGMDLYPFRNSFDIMKRLGDTIRHADNWKKYSVIDIIDSYPKEPISIIFDCGLDDFFYPTNYLLHVKMVGLNIMHEYIERPGKHDWAYWANAIEYQLLFFRKFFEKNQKEY